MNSTLPRVALRLSAAASLAYLLVPKSAPLPLEVVLKGLSVTLLALVALRAGRWPLALALGLSSAGDVLLACGARFFVPGLAAFLCAHLVYVALFLRRGARPGHALSRFVFPITLLLYGLVFGAWLAPSLGALRLPVFAYIAAILAMVAAAHLANYGNRSVLLGAVLFLLSDSLLGSNRFKTPIPLAGPLIWITYYAAQIAITRGVLSDPAGRLKGGR